MSKRVSIDTLTGLRFFAALWVVVFHMGRGWLESIRFPEFQVGPFYVQVQNFPVAIANFGYAAVSLFFLLSGFILAYAYLQLGQKQSISKKSFWVARLARLYPLYIFAAVIEATRLIFGLDST